jgi:hypothetical protein
VDRSALSTFKPIPVWQRQVAISRNFGVDAANDIAYDIV